MSMLIQLAIYAAIAGAAFFAFNGFVSSHYVKPAVAAAVAKQLAADSEVLESVKKDRDQWKTAEAARESENAELQAQMKIAADADARYKAQSAAAQKRSKAALDELATKNIEANAEALRLLSIVTSKGATGSAEDQLPRIDAEITKALKSRRVAP